MPTVMAVISAGVLSVAVREPLKSLLGIRTSAAAALAAWLAIFWGIRRLLLALREGIE